MRLKNTNLQANLLVFAICLMAFIFNADYLAVNLALNPIMSEFHSNLTTLQWTLSGYMIAWALLVIPAGKLLNFYTSKKLALSAIGLFLLASMGCGLAIDTSTLIIARLIQGGSAALFVPTIYMVIVNNFPSDQQGRVTGIIGFAVGVGLALGPIIGGFLINWFSWRSIFFINVPIGLLALIIIKLCDKAGAPDSSIQPRISIASLVLLSSFIISILLVLCNQDRVKDQLLNSILGLWSFISILTFILLQKRITNPLIPLPLFSNRQFIGCCLGIFIMEYAFSSTIIVATLYLQNSLKLSVYESSFIFLWITLVFGVMAIIGGRWTDKTPHRLPIAMGFIVMTLSMISFSYFAPIGNLHWIEALFLLIGLGAGLTYAALNASIIKAVLVQEIGIASSVFLMLTLLGNAIGVAVTVIIYNNDAHLTGLVFSMNSTAIMCLIGAYCSYTLITINLNVQPNSQSQVIGAQ